MQKVPILLFPLVSRVGDVSSLTIENYGWRGFQLATRASVLNSAQVEVFLDAYDPFEGAAVAMQSLVVLNAVARGIYSFYPGLAAPNGMILPTQFQIRCVPADGAANTYSVALTLLP